MAPRSSSLSMEFWIGVSLILFGWWILNRPGADLEVTKYVFDRCAVFAVCFLLARTGLKAMTLTKK